MKCKLCGDILDTEHPESLYGRNPETFRMAWMHYWCFDESANQLKHIPASDHRKADSRFDELLDLITEEG